MPVSVTVAPATDVLTLAEAKAHLRIATSGDDTLITALNSAAGLAIERRCRRAFITQTLLLTLPEWPGDVIYIPRPSLISVGSVKYRDTAGALQTEAGTVYHVETEAHPGRVSLLADQSWSNTETHPQAVQVTYDAGYGASAAVPEDIKQAIRIQLDVLWDGRTKSREDAIAALIAPHRIHSTPAAMGTL